MLFGAAVEADTGNPERLQMISRSVAQAAKAVGLDLSSMDLTPNGFVPAKGR
jgi:hypothetical protein